MEFIETLCFLSELDNEMLTQCQPFSCGDADLDDFFTNSSDNYIRQLLGKSYCYRLKEDPTIIVCVFTLANSSIDVRHFPGSRRKKLAEHVPREKHLSSYPAYLVCRLGVNTAFRGKGIGSDLMNNVKLWIMKPDTKGGCRFLTVDAYNNEATRRYYFANGFKDAFSTEQQEKEYLGMSPEKELKTRLMYFDLMLLSDKT